VRRARSSRTNATETMDAIRATGVLRGVNPIPPVELLEDDGVGDCVEIGMIVGRDVEDTEDGNDVVELDSTEEEVEVEELIEYDDEDDVEKVFIGVQ
jgi:hypothetical protein